MACSPPRVMRWGASALLLGALLAGAAPQQQGDSVDGILDVLGQPAGERTGPLADRGALLQAGFNAFIERMDAFDGASSLALARSLFREDPAIWSGFCLEGALRRSAGAEPEPSDAGLAEAEAMLEQLRDGQTDPAAHLAVVHRLAILYSGFGRPGPERQALGAALGVGGIDGVQITGLSALRAGDHGTAAKLFGSLLDRMPRQDDGSVMPPSTIDTGGAVAAPLAIQPESAPWALRGHALGTLELLRNDSSIPD